MLTNYNQQMQESIKIITELQKFCKYTGEGKKSAFSYIANLETQTIISIVSDKKYHQDFTRDEFEVELRNFFKTNPEGDWSDLFNPFAAAPIPRQNIPVADNVVEIFMQKYRQGFDLEKNEDWQFVRDYLRTTTN